MKIGNDYPQHLATWQVEATSLACMRLYRQWLMLIHMAVWIVALLSSRGLVGDNKPEP